MQFNRPDARRDRLSEPARQSLLDGRRAPHRGAGIGLLGYITGALLISLGFLAAVALGMLTGVVSPQQLTAAFTGGATPVTPQPAAVPAAEAKSTPPAATPGAPATEARVLREETYGDWRYFCVEGTAGAAPVCSAVQQLRVAQTGAAVFIWRIVQDGRGGLVGIWQVPDTVLLAAGLTLDAGTPKPLVIPFESCSAGSCQVVANLAADFIQSMSSANTLSATVTLKNRENVKFPLSPKGLGEALAALSK